MSSNYRKLPGGRYLGLLAAIAFGLFAAPASASQASSFSGKPGTIIYNIKSRDFTKILQVE